MRSSLLLAASALAILGGTTTAFAQTDGGDIRIGGRVTATTDSDGRDYRIQLERGQGVEITLRSTDVDPVVYLYGPDNLDEAVAQDDDGMGEGLNSRLRYVAREAGTYTIRASAFEEGNVTLAVARWQPPVVRSTPITVGRSDNGRVTNRSPQDESNRYFQQYRIALTRGQRIELTVDSEEIDPLVQVGTDTGVFEELDMNDDGDGGGLNSYLVFTAREAGDYVIRVTSASGTDQGRYKLSVGQAKPLAEAVPVTLEETVSGTIQSSTPSGQSGKRADRYSLNAELGSAYQIDLSSDDFDSFLSIFDSNGTLVVENDDGGDNLNSSINFVPKEAGTYIIEASSLSGSEGSYELVVEGVEPPPPPATLAFEQMVEGELTDDDARSSAGGRYDAYVFAATEGQRLQIDLGSSDFDALLEIGNAEGTFEALESDDDGAGKGTDSRLLFTVPSDGNYEVRVRSFNDDERGAYEVELKDRGPEPVAGSISIGATARGKLSDSDNAVVGMMGAAHYDDYVFTATKEDKLRFILVAPTFDAVVMVGQGTGDEFNSTKQDDDGLSDTHSRLNWTAPRDGEYVVRVTSFGGNSTGDYSLIMERQP